jgi:hypothetical protein
MKIDAAVVPKVPLLEKIFFFFLSSDAKHKAFSMLDTLPLYSFAHRGCHLLDLRKK